MNIGAIIGIMLGIRFTNHGAPLSNQKVINAANSGNAKPCGGKWQANPDLAKALRTLWARVETLHGASSYKGWRESPIYNESCVLTLNA